MALAVNERTQKPILGVALLAFVALSLGVGGLGGVITSSSLLDWYPTLQRPPLTPPDSVFGPVWTVLYVMMGVSVGLVWGREDAFVRRQVLALFATQLGVNFLWSLLFFGLHSPLLALIDIVILVVLVGGMTRFFWWRHKLAGLLLLPYLFWILFATYLNAGFWLMNTPAT